jgi:hypothetical protein
MLWLGLHKLARFRKETKLKWDEKGGDDGVKKRRWPGHI